jgi:hypothetical protein
MNQYSKDLLKQVLSFLQAKPVATSLLVKKLVGVALATPTLPKTLCVKPH